MSKTYKHAYDFDAVEREIKRSRKPICRREQKAIHALLKGWRGVSLMEAAHA